MTNAVMFTAPLHVCQHRNAAGDRRVPENILATMHRASAQLTTGGLKREGFAYVTYID